MATPKLRDLGSYVRRSGRQCSTCTSEHRDFIEQAYDKGYVLSAVISYLNDQFDASLNVIRVRWHFREGHHETKSKRA